MIPTGCPAAKMAVSAAASSLRSTSCTVTNGQSALICAAALLKSVLRVRLDELERFFDVLCEGYARGRRCESLLTVKFERLWREPLEALRARLRIEPLR